MIFQRDLLGVWHLASVELVNARGQIEYPFGLQPRGSILYLAEGSMAVHISGSDQAAGRMRIYGGRWSIAGDRVVHQVETSYESELIGQRLERRAELHDGRLIYRTLEAQGPGHPVVVWTRQKADRQGTGARPRMTPPHACFVIPFLLLLASVAHACSVPVFAYALRRWEPEAHTLTTPRDEAWRRGLAEQAGTASLNLVIEAGAGEDRFSHKAMDDPWWTGSLDDPHQRTLIASPLRRELAKRLASGTTAVWLFIPGGDAAADAAARALLSERLAYLKKVVELPAPDPDDPAASAAIAMAGPPIRLDFSILDLRRDDAAEWVLAAQALAMDRHASGPCAIPVYGRARALDLLQGATFTAATIDDIVRFLTGACSCQVKDLNPGWDLLVACDWDGALREATQEPAPAPGPNVASAAPETVVIAPVQPGSGPAKAPPPVDPAVTSSANPYATAALAILALVGLLAVILRLWQRSRSKT